MFWKKKNNITTLSLQCNGTGSECDLINELRSLQEELKEYSYKEIDSNMIRIWDDLFAWNKRGEKDYDANRKYVEDFMSWSTCLIPEFALTWFIDKLCEYRDLLHKRNSTEEKRKEINNRIEEIKNTLGIE